MVGRIQRKVKGRPHVRTRGYFTSYFCTCTTFSASYTYKGTCACTSTTSSDSVGFFVRRTRVRRTNERACFKGRPHGRTRGYFTSYFCTCMTFSASYTYKSTCTSTTSSNMLDFLYVMHVYDVQMYELAVFR